MSDPEKLARAIVHLAGIYAPTIDPERPTVAEIIYAAGVDEVAITFDISHVQIARAVMAARRSQSVGVCGARWGTLSCDLPAGHAEMKHAVATGRDAEGRVDDGVQWADEYPRLRALSYAELSTAMGIPPFESLG